MKPTPRSSIRDLVWPAVVRGEGATLLALEMQLEQSQWWSPEEMRSHQYRQLEALLRHARATVPFYGDRLAGAGLAGGPALTPEAWLRIPLLTRQELRSRQADLLSGAVPESHGGTNRHKTSGSTGTPLEVTGTSVCGLFWEAAALRDDLWHERDMAGRFVAIRSGRYKADPLAVHDLPSWGFNPPSLYRCGPMTVFYHLQPLPRQAELLEARSPHYALMYPSNARALCHHARKRPIRLPDLRAVHTYGEAVTPGIRAAVRETWGVPVHDVYSCEEMGILALQCPRHEHYHVQSELVLLEVLDEEGNPCAPGQIGRVVLTSLHNFAMPLVRYAIGDYAEVGAPCPCGRGLPVLKRVLGRRRNRVSLPNGRWTWPDLDALWTAIPDVEQIQVVQSGEDHMEVRFARAEPLTSSEMHESTIRIRCALGHPFRLTFTGRESILRQPNGKYETFFDARP